MFEIVSEVPASEADMCDEVSAKAAAAALASQSVPARANYSPKTWS